YGKRMEAHAGPAPTVRDRLFSSYGLLRDPEKERPVIEFYRKYHRAAAESIVALAGSIKEALARPLVCGTFYGYLLEVPRIHEAGHLAPDVVLDSPHIDLLAGPYSYQSTNDPASERWESDLYDGADNWLGRARGVGGDGAFRLMLESLRRRGKLYASEIDPSTYLDEVDGWRGIGGSGSKTAKGSVQILQRDVGKVFAEGVAGWLYDFGPLHGVPTGWYGSPELIESVKPIMDLMRRRRELDLSPAAKTAMIVDHRCSFVTQHWLADRPWEGQGIRYTDLFNHWFLNSQNRALQRLGAPVDYLHHFDFEDLDAQNYRLILFPNAFTMTSTELDSLRSKLAGSGATVVWYYAPGLLSDRTANLESMTALTGFKFSELLKPGPLMITCEQRSGDAVQLPLSFGVKSAQNYRPRFSVDDRDIEVLGHWTDAPKRVAFAKREMDGWTSIFVGTAPVPSRWLRRLASHAGVPLWSSSADVVCGTRSTAMICAQSDGQRILTLPTPMVSAGGGDPMREHRLDLKFGDVQLFIADEDARR
ncbi:MAG: hypothetical protein HKN13_09845, partial [Rhodothermales bacterium]|nr:hypothetical protein [Rhodothermales bacterium]